MEKILENYLKETTPYDTIIISYFNVDGAICSVKYRTDEYYPSETVNIKTIIRLNKRRLALDINTINK